MRSLTDTSPVVVEHSGDAAIYFRMIDRRVVALGTLLLNPPAPVLDLKKALRRRRSLLVE
jgi:hypothetical protein